MQGVGSAFYRERNFYGAKRRPKAATCRCARAPSCRTPTTQKHRHFIDIGSGGGLEDGKRTREGSVYDAVLLANELTSAFE